MKTCKTLPQKILPHKPSQVLVMCEVALQSKSAQIVAPNVCWETPLNHNSYTTEYPESLCLAHCQHSSRYNHPVKEMSNTKYCCRDLETFLTVSLVSFYRAMHVVLARYCYRKSSVRPSVRPSVCPSVTLMYREHVGWTSSKLITRIISLGPSLLGATTSAI